MFGDRPRQLANSFLFIAGGSKRFKFPGKIADTEPQDAVANFINTSRSPKTDGFQGTVHDYSQP